MLSGLKWLSPLFVIDFYTFNILGTNILGTVASGVGIFSGLNSIFGGGGGGASPTTGTTAGGTVYDPFAQYRQQFGGQLAGMMSPGASFTTSDPSYQFRFGQGLETLNRTLGAQHLLGSGNRLQELMGYGQGMASQEYGNQFNRLASLAGVSQTRGSNYGALQAQQQQLGWNALAQGLGGLSNVLGSGGGETTDMTGFISDPWSSGATSYSPYSGPSAGVFDSFGGY